MNRWSGKVAVVTGASAGIGSAICVALASAGVRVVGLARRPHLVDELQSRVKGGGSIVSRKCDVSNCEQVAAAFRWIEKEVGAVHILVNNAGVYFDGQITDLGDKMLSEDEVSATIDTNVKGPIVCSRFAIGCMRRHAIDGHIVTINSIAGHYVPFAANFNVYPSTKHAITAFHATLEGELAHYNSNIKTTSVSPALVATNMAGQAAVACRPALSASDVAEAVLYALSTPPHVNISELTVTPVPQERL